MLTGTVLASLGLFLLQGAGAVTGGTAGLSLLLTHLLPVSFAGIFVTVSAPFILLGARRRGWGFATRTVAAVVVVSGLSLLQPGAITLTRLSPVYGTLVGNLLCGLGILILFRHGASLGGFNIVALVAQQRRRWRAGYVQLVLDGLVLALYALTAPGPALLYSAAGTVVLNLVLAMNHRPGRYLGA